jgi:translation initiation factor 2 alpha subunit (eIF-2alpha)
MELYEVNGKPAIKIMAKVLARNQKNTAVLLDCEGDKKWFPLSVIKINSEQGTVLIQEWKYKQEFD